MRRRARRPRRRLTLLGLLAVVALPLAAAPAAAGENLGERIVRGRVYNLERGEAVAIASATVSFRNLDRTGAEASGLAVTDVNGNFAFPLLLSSTDLVRLRASAPGFEPYTTSARADTLVGRTPAIEMGLARPNPNARVIRGHLSDGSRCTVDAGDVQVRLRRTGRTTRSSSAGAFHFIDVEDGDYELHIGRFDLELPIVVAGRDVEVQFCLTCPELPELEPSEAPPGATVIVSGDECGALAPARTATIYFDDTVVATVATGQAGNFRATFEVPANAVGGPHRVRVFGEDVAEIASAVLLVGESCPGDCNGDREVVVSELLRGVAIALGTPGVPCAAFGEDVAISDLVTAVDRALSGCDES